MEDVAVSDKEIEDEKRKFSIHCRSFEVLFKRLGREKIDRLMLQVWKRNAAELSEKMAELDTDTLGPRMCFSIGAAKGVLAVMGKDQNMSVETFKGLRKAIYKLGQTRFDDSFPHKDDKYGDADRVALGLLHEIEMVSFFNYSEKELLDILETGSEGADLQEVARSIRAAQAKIAETPDGASARFDELASVGDFDILGHPIEVGKLKS